MGHMRKLRFASILAGGIIVAGGTGVAMAQGGISANLALSGTVMDMTVGSMTGDTTSLFVGSEEADGGATGVSNLKFVGATASDVCLSVPIPNIPGLGEAVFKLQVPGQNFSAKNLLLGAKSVDGDLTMNSAQIGVDANQVDSRAAQGSWGLFTNQLLVNDTRIEATSLAADQLSVAGAQINVLRGSDSGC